MSQKRLLKLWSERISPIVATSMLSTLALSGLSGCDTVALLSFSDRAFNEVHVVGLSPEGGACKGSSGDAVIRFIMADGDGYPIDDATVIGNSAVSLDRDDVAVEDVVVYELPDVVCTSSADCSSGVACESTDYGGQACQLGSESISVSGTPRIVSSSSASQAFAVLVENSASIHGELPLPIEEYKPDIRNANGDVDENGYPVPDGRTDAVGTNYTLKNDLRATDSNNSRLTAVSNMAQKWEDVQERAAVDNQVRSSFGIWTFNRGVDNVRSPNDFGWVSSGSGARQAARSLNEVGSNDNVAAVYEAMIHAIESEDIFGGVSADEKILTMVVDGPDDIRSDRQNVQAVIDAANAADVRVFIVHIDPEVQVYTDSGDKLIPDVVTYVQQQDNTCASDDECKNFEACRPVTGYANNENSNVSNPAGKLEGSYCAIEYTMSSFTKGRIGPIQEYSEIACATGGGYLYFPSRDKLAEGNSTVARLPLAMDSLWEVPVNVSAFSSGAVEADEPYKMGMIFSTTIDGTQRRHSMTGDIIAPRPVIFSAE